MPKASPYGVKGLRKLPDDTWVIDLRWREPGTGEPRRFQQNLGKLPTAAAKANGQRVVAAALSGGFDPKKAPARRLGDALKEWRKMREADSSAGQSAKRAKAAERFLAAWGDVELTKMGALHLERYKRDRASGADKVASASVNRELEFAHNFFKLAAEWGWIPWEQFRQIRKVPHLKEPPGRVRSVTHEEEDRLLEALPRGARPIILAALLTGMRESELVTLRKAAVDLRAGVITLTKTKSNHVRNVPINPALAEIFKVAMAEPNDSAFVFVTRRKAEKRPYTAAGLRAIWNRAKVKAKVDDLRLHDLRHSFATRLRRAGVGIDAIALLLGHSSLAMATRYAHLADKTLRDAVGKLPAPRVGT